MFDLIINEAQEKFNLGDKAGILLSSLLGLIVNPANGGFGGFINRFHNAGLGNLVDSWVKTGNNMPISNEQLESALGEDTINAVAEQAGIDKATTAPALAFMTPYVVDALTPDGELPDEAGLISKIGDFLKNYGGAIGAVILGALASGAAGATYGKVTGALSSVGDTLDGDGDNDSILKWLIPLLLLGLLVVLGYWLFGK